MDRRHGIRSKCVMNSLVDINGHKYPCTLDNFSFSGAMVNYVFSDLELRPGESCSLNLCNNSKKCIEYPCQIVRIASNEIGLRFINW